MLKPTRKPTAKGKVFISIIESEFTSIYETVQ